MEKLKPSDLRIGNFIRATLAVLDDINGGESFAERTIKCGRDIDNAEWFEPIPLTEDWLEKFGLIKEYEENPFEDGGYSLDEKGNKWYYWVDAGTFNLEIQSNGEIWFEIYSCYRHIKYVHELQNLYFALTGTELKISATVAPTI